MPDSRARPLTRLIRVAVGGELRAVYHDELAALLRQLGGLRVFRASHVEPSDVADAWQADLSPVGGPLLGPYSTQEEAKCCEV